eukprot:CAMPEP_0176214154 /NCGR_PEP_ID=MMETSP0121_2-20121125/16024_1 /TAXON_ID=160619 /ORGANISM="Kryptoperidinium foliaceum, Strain CCMP 1326" /LENGTH=211 /DNA_ID=CAMNT_0017553231 /DNA_START=1 /DNA_END=632 /DNA_ORIENTATION=+
MFKVMQMDFEPMEPLFAWAPVSKYIIMLYVVITNWAIFSILTAVICDEMAKVTQKLEEDNAAAEQSQKNSKLIAQIFDRVDSNGTGAITQSQLHQLLDSEEEAHELCDAAEIEPEDLKEVFAILSQRKEGGADLHITRHAFLSGLEREREAVNQRVILKLEKRLDVMGDSMAEGMARMEALIAKALAMHGQSPGSRTTQGTGTSQRAPKRL